MGAKLRQVIEDARYTLDLAILAAWDALLTVGERAYALAETMVGSMVLSLFIGAAFVWLGQGIEVASVPTGLFVCGIIAGSFAWILNRLPYMRRIKRESEEALARLRHTDTEARVKHAEYLGWAEGYEAGWKAAKAVDDYYANAAYRLRGGPREDE